MEAMTGVKAQDILGKGNYEYALPFYGERRPILIDYVFKEEEEFRAKYAQVSRRGEVLCGETYVPQLKEGGAYLTATAGGLYDAAENLTGPSKSSGITPSVNTWKKRCTGKTNIWRRCMKPPWA